MSARGQRGLVLVAAALLAVAGCTGDPPTEDHAAPSSSAPAPSKDPVAKEKQTVLDVYRSLTRAEYHSYATGQLDSRVRKLAADKALSNIKATLFRYTQHDIVIKGEVKRSPKVTAIDLEADPMTATVTDCMDTEHVDPYDANTGKRIEFDGKRRHLATATAKYTERGWVFFTSVINRDRTC